MIPIPQRVATLGTFLILAVLAGDAMLVVRSLDTIARSNGRVDHTQLVLNELESTLSVIKDAETGQRGFLLTGRDDYLGPFREAESALPGHLARLATLTADNAVQQARLADLGNLAAEKMSELRHTIALRRDEGLNAALLVVLTDRGQETMRTIRQRVAAIREEEERLLKARVEASQAAVWRTFTTFTVTTVAAVLLVVLVGYLQRREAAEREQAAEALRKSEAWLATTLSSIGDAVIATDRQGRIRFMNPVAETLTGWPQGEAVGKSFADVFQLVNEETGAPAPHPCERVLREGVVVGLANHTALIARDGRATPIEDSAAPIRDRDHGLAGVVMVFRDVTATRAAQERLRASEARTAAILDSALDAIITFDHGGAVLEFNPAAERIFGYKIGEVVGRDIIDLIIPPALRGSYHDGMSRYLSAGDGSLLNRQIEIQAMRADRTEFPAELAVTRITSNGQPIYTAHVRDIAARHDTERRRSARLAVTQLLAESVSLAEAAPRLLRAVCEGLGWDVGALWTQAEGEEVLRCNSLWQSPAVRVDQFATASYNLVLPRGVGLAGRAWQSRQPLWIANVGAQEGLPRARVAAAEGLHGALAMPLAAGERFLGALEFFSAQVKEPDLDLIEMMTTIGGQVGQFIDGQRMEAQRALAETQLRASEAQFRTLADSIPQLAWMARADGSVFWFNKRLYEYT
jgi:PAS domain S-box-containing protein